MDHVHHAAIVPAKLIADELRLAHPPAPHLTVLASGLYDYFPIRLRHTSLLSPDHDCIGFLMVEFSIL